MKKSVGLLVGLLLPLFQTFAQAPPETPAPEAPTPPAVSPATGELVKMAESGTSDDVLLGYIKNSTATFDLTADQILYLRDIGLSSPVITAMLTRDAEVRVQTVPMTATAPPPAAPVAATASPSAALPVTQPTPPPVEPPPVPQQAAPAEAPLTPPPAYVSSPPEEVGYFYDNLSPYGTWVQLEGVGWCWQPRVVVINHGWRPYCDSGHWVNTDAGWFWQSDYSWGWAPFHYGRWQLHSRCGWVWQPDRVWGPAWVTWRSEGDHCGWAPLPPRADFDVRFGYRFNGVHVGLTFDFGLRPEHFTFIALRDFHQHDFAHHSLPPAQVTRIYSHTTIINNYVVNNHTVVNQGIKVDRVSAATHTQFKKVAIRDVPAGSPSRAGGRTELAVYRPQLKAPARPVNMVAQKVDARHPVIQQPVVPVRSQTPRVAGESTSPRGGLNRGSQGKNPLNWEQPAGERARSQTQTPSRTYRPAGSPDPSGNNPAVRTQPGASQQSRPSVNPQRDSGKSQTYSPKGNYQSPETRNSRQSNPPDSKSRSQGNGPSNKNDR